MGENKILNAISAKSLRVLINAANNDNIKKEDIVTLTKEGEEFVLVYYVK
jgi:hypothetical protein